MPCNGEADGVPVSCASGEGLEGMPGARRTRWRSRRPSQRQLSPRRPDEADDGVPRGGRGPRSPMPTDD